MSTTPRTAIPSPLAQSGQWAPLLLGLFMVSIVLGASLEVAGMRLSPTRVVVLLAFVPVAVAMLSGRLGKPLAPDYLFIFFSLWMVVSILVNDGLGRLPFALISGVELLGGYLLGRYLIRSAHDFRAFAYWHLALLAVMAPFAAIEFVSGTQIWAQILDIIGDVEYRGQTSYGRWGFERALVGFEHPILFGVFCSMAAANIFYIWRPRPVLAAGGFGFAATMTFLSLSSGALLSVLMQSMMMAWDWVTKGKWKLLVILAGSVFVFLSVASNRGPVVLLIETMTFNAYTGWTRMVQWQFVGADIMRSPVFGFGVDRNYLRPDWLTASIDSYWLVVAYRHGLPGVCAVLLALALIIRRIVTAKGLSEEAARMRTGYMLVLAGVMFSITTVHIWDANVVFFFFYIGGGLWFAEVSAQGTSESTPEAEAAPAWHSPYSRFAPKPRPDSTVARRVSPAQRTAR